MGSPFLLFSECKNLVPNKGVSGKVKILVPGGVANLILMG